MPEAAAAAAAVAADTRPAARGGVVWLLFFTWLCKFCMALERRARLGEGRDRVWSSLEVAIVVLA